MEQIQPYDKNEINESYIDYFPHLMHSGKPFQF
jgi:hypothetical protein